MKISANCMNLIKQHEGFRAKAYLDSKGYLTIGYGRNLESKGISQHEAEILLQNDCLDAFAFCQKLNYFASLNEARQAAILDMVFNLGAAGFMKFKKLQENLRLCDFDNASGEILNSKWASQVGNRAKTIANMIKNGKFENRSK